MKKWLKKLVNDNDITILCLCLFPFLAVATTFELAYIMGLSILLTMLLSNILISLIAKFINKGIRIYINIIVAAIFTTLLDIFMDSYISSLSIVLGIYIPLIAINISIFNKDESKSIKESVIESLRYGLIILISLSLIGLIRELLGSNTITVMDKISSITGYIAKYEVFPENNIIPNQLLLTSAGAFLIMGLILGSIKALKGGDTK